MFMLISVTLAFISQHCSQLKNKLLFITVTYLRIYSLSLFGELDIILVLTIKIILKFIMKLSMGRRAM